MRTIPTADSAELHRLGVLQHRGARSAAPAALNISNQALEKMHPADLADIVEELGPDDREAIIETIDTEVAAEALSEMDRMFRRASSNRSKRKSAAEIIEEMSPDEAADALAELEEETSREILEEMTEESKTEVSELHRISRTHGGSNDEHRICRAAETATVQDAIESLTRTKNCSKSLNTLFLVDGEERLTGAVPLARLFVAPGGEAA